MFSAKEKKVYIKTKDDKLLDAATGKPAEGAAPDDIDNVRLNNRLRGVVDAAIGALTLMAPRSEQALRRRPGGVQVARRGGACRRSKRRSPRKKTRASKRR